MRPLRTRRFGRLGPATAAVLLLGGCFHHGGGAPEDTSGAALAYLQAGRGVFGIITGQAEGQPRFVETDSVPNVEGQSYGWIIPVGDSSSPVSWTEVLTLPAPAAVWSGMGSSSDVSINRDGSSAVTHRKAVPRGGLIFNFWSVARGDPDGEYTIVVTPDSGREYRFRFSLQKPAGRPDADQLKDE
jgi:hypothetical protein